MIRGDSVMNKKENSLCRILGVIGFLGFGLLTLLVAGKGFAAPNATYIVNSSDDSDDGTCDGGHCSLREAVQAANGNGGADTISFSLLPSSTIVLAGSQLPTITDTLTIDGSTAVSLTISGDNLTRTFQIGSGTAVTLSTMTIKDGESFSGGAIYNDGGLLILEDIVLRDNAAYFAGAIYNDGWLEIADSIVQDNRVVDQAGGIFNTENGMVIVSGSLFFGNNAYRMDGLSAIGGAIFNEGTVTIIQSAFNSNYTFATDMTPFPVTIPSSRSGAIENGGILAIFDSTFMNNGTTTAAPYFAGFFDDFTETESGGYTADGGAIDNYGHLTISNSTFSGNRATVALTFNNSFQSGNLARGGAIVNSTIMTITNSTFSGNVTTLYPSDPLNGGSIYNTGTMNFSNTIIANSEESGDCISQGTIGLNVRNLVEDGDCNPALTGDPLLGPLQDNGGPTWTHALTAPSPAVDGGDDAACAAPPINNLDQRGVTRPLDGNGDGSPRCDIGAYEYDGPPPDRVYLSLFRKN
jgi:CSLREA domain-containing protein